MKKAFIILLLSVLVFAAEDRQQPTNPKCRQPLNLGTSCAAKKPTIRYHMDPETLTCLAFKHNGCGGNDNSFATKGECSQTCIPADYLTCSANSPAVRRPNGDASCQTNMILIGGETSLDSACPKGSTCQMGFVVGLCCNDTITAAVSANYKPDCGPGKKAFKSEQYGFQLIHLGKTCDSNFCPDNSVCRQGSYFAYCCY
ncbi:unnamed protein product [Auanema sp. JU1783]|nr:unnamed protein product [Auanema sp. JU1783]